MSKRSKSIIEVIILAVLLASTIAVWQRWGTPFGALGMLVIASVQHKRLWAFAQFAWIASLIGIYVKRDGRAGAGQSNLEASSSLEV